MSASVLIALAAVYVIWGSTYLAIRFAIETMPPLFMAGTRFLVGGAILFAWQIFRGRPKPTAREWRSASIVGAALLLGGNGLVVLAERAVPSGIAALVVSMVPLWMVIVEWIWGGEKPTWATIVGLIGGFGGVLLLFGPGVFSGHAAVDPAGMILLLTACVSWAAGSIYSRRAPLPKPHLMAVAAEMLAGGVILLIIGAALGEGAVLRLSDISTKSWLALAYLIFFGALIGFTAYTWLLQNTSVAITSTYAYINPVVAIALGAWLAAEPITSLTLAASALIIGSVVLITTQRKV